MCESAARYQHKYKDVGMTRFGVVRRGKVRFL